MLHALHWLESAVKDDNPYAEHLLGKTFLKGEDVERDTDRASLLRRSSEQGNNMRRTPRQGIATEMSSLKTLTKPCAAAELSASKILLRYNLSSAGLYKGERSPRDIKKAVEWFDRVPHRKIHMRRTLQAKYI
ncbi:MAG: hypothetical protein ACLR56_10985 [Oscillospiraceae bacterium]